MIIFINTQPGKARREVDASSVSTTPQIAVATFPILYSGRRGSHAYPARRGSGPGCSRSFASSSATIGTTADPRGRTPGAAPDRKSGCGHPQLLAREFRAGPAFSETRSGSKRDATERNRDARSDDL